MAFKTRRYSFEALQQTFVVNRDYVFRKELGQGENGFVVAAKNRRTGEGCAIKKIANIGTKVRPPFQPSPVYARSIFGG